MSHFKGMMSLDTVKRVSSLMEYLMECEGEASIRDIGHAADIPKSTVQRMLSSLEETGWVYQNPATQAYRIGFHFLSFANSWRFRLELVKQTQAILEELSESTRETALLVVLDGDCGRCINKVEPEKTLKLVAEVGKTFPLHAAACGKILFAFCPEETRERVLSGSLAVYTPKTLVDPDSLRRELGLIRKRGFAESYEELTLGAAEIAVPLVDSQSRLVAGLSVAGAKKDITDGFERILSLLREKAQLVAGRIRNGKAGA